MDTDCTSQKTSLLSAELDVPCSIAVRYLESKISRAQRHGYTVLNHEVIDHDLTSSLLVDAYYTTSIPAANGCLQLHP
jgi:hypothetical protein